MRTSRTEMVAQESKQRQRRTQSWHVKCAYFTITRCRVRRLEPCSCKIFGFGRTGSHVVGGLRLAHGTKLKRIVTRDNAVCHVTASRMSQPYKLGRYLRPSIAFPSTTRYLSSSERSEQLTLIYYLRFQLNLKYVLEYVADATWGSLHIVVPLLSFHPDISLHQLLAITAFCRLFHQYSSTLVNIL